MSLKGLISFSTLLNTDVKVVNDAVFSSTNGYKKWKFMGVTLFNRDYNEAIGTVEFLDKDSTENQQWVLIKRRRSRLI